MQASWPTIPALPDTWSETENVVWKVDVPGLGWSSPIVWDDHVFLTSAISAGKEPAPVAGLYDEHDHVKAAAPQRWMVYDFDFKTGKLRWEREMHQGAPPLLRHIKNSYASETPVTDGERLYVYFGNIGLVAALDFKGNVVWSKNVGAYNTQVELGTGASPVLYKDRLLHRQRQHDAIVSDRLDSPDRQGTLARRPRRARQLVDAGHLGERAADRDRDHRHDQEPIVRPGRQAPVGAERHVDAHDSVAVHQARAWSSSARAIRAARFVRCTRSGTARTGTSRSSRIRPSNDYIVWHQPLLGTYNTSALVYGDIYYTLLDRGFLLAHDARTGKQIYGRQRISVDSSGFTTSPWAYNGKIFLMSEDGDTFVVQAGPEFKLLGKNSLNEMPLATPAVLRGSLIVRT